MTSEEREFHCKKLTAFCKENKINSEAIDHMLFMGPYGLAIPHGHMVALQQPGTFANDCPICKENRHKWLVQ